MNKIKYNLKNVHAAIQSHTEDGGYSYDTPKAIPGAVSLSLDAEGETSPFHADGIVYFRAVSNNGYSGDLNIAMVPDWFRQEYLGDTLSEKDKVLVESTQAEPKPFALLYEFLGDASHRRHCLYNTTAARPNIKGENKGNQKEPDTESLSLTSLPLPDGKVKASPTADTPQAVYDGWNKAVWVKDTTTT